MMPFPPKFIPPLGPPRLSARDRVRSEWLGYNQVEVEKEAALRVKQVGNLIPGVMSSIRIDNRRVEVEIVKVWNQALDPLITAHAQPTGLRKGTLFVSVDSSVWLSELVRYRRKEILERLQYSFGRDLIAKIAFRVG